MSPVLHQAFAEHVSSQEQTKNTQQFPVCSLQQSQQGEPARRHWEIIRIVYTLTDRQTCSLWLQSQQASLPVVACQGWMQE